jgi:hypothetical protein
MAKYIMVYKGEATDMAAMTPEEGAAVMEKWGVWMGKVGPALVDIGSPFGPGDSVVDDGTAGAAASLSGYSILEASSMADARGLADGHPYLSEGKGDYAIDIYEMMPVPFEE